MATMTRIRLGLWLPETAQHILQQEGRFKKYQDELQGFLDEYNKLDESMPQKLKALLAPHLADLDRTFPALTWSNIRIFDGSMGG